MISSKLNIILHVAENDPKYRDVAPLTYAHGKFQAESFLTDMGTTTQVACKQAFRSSDGGGASHLVAGASRQMINLLRSSKSEACSQATTQGC